MSTLQLQSSDGAIIEVGTLLLLQEPQAREQEDTDIDLLTQSELLRNAPSS